MTPIQICLWFDNQAEAAANLYLSAFRNSRRGGVVRYGKAAANASGQPGESVMTVELELEGLKLLTLNGGPHFRINPAISFFVGCESESEIDELWGKLSKTVRMELKRYPWAPKYGWCEDPFGVNWQLMLGPRRQKISPALLFANQRFGKAAEAVHFYVSQFPDAKIDTMARDEKTGAVLHSVFRLCGQDFVILEGPLEHEFDFSCAVSFIVGCESQAEIDGLWERLSAVPEAERCGWLKDKYGVSWQIVPRDWGKWLREATPVQRERLMGAILRMKKPDLNALQAAYAG